VCDDCLAYDRDAPPPTQAEDDAYNMGWIDGRNAGYYDGYLDGRNLEPNELEVQAHESAVQKGQI
jgi:hypothetical protein